MSARDAYPHFQTISTRWKDNDAYGHVNNVEYYSFFDTVINTYLIAAGGLDFAAGPAIGLCAESHCRYLAPLAFPAPVEAGLRVAHLGRSSVRYEIALFAADAVEPAAKGWFVHVFVDRADRRPCAIPEPLRRAMAALRAGDETATVDEADSPGNLPTEAEP